VRADARMTPRRQLSIDVEQQVILARMPRSLPVGGLE
jgi:hypothetical protein